MKQQNQQTKQSGFAHMGVVITAVLVVLALAFGGWWVWDKNKDEDQPTKNSHSETKSEPTQQSEEDKYLVIKEWGVRIALPEHLRGDISYFVNQKIYDDFGVERFDLVSRRFSEGDLKCAAIEEGSPRSLVNIERQIDGQGGGTVEPQPFKRIDDMRFYLTGSFCEEAINREGSQQDKQLIIDLKKAASETLEKIE